MAEITYRKAYKMRTVGTGGYEVTVPKEIVERAARKRGLSVDEFLKRYKLVHLFNDFKTIDAAYRFEPIEEDIEILTPPEIQ
jgi:hypothetical protein